MGGLKKAMGWTHAYMGLASLALSGIGIAGLGFAGYFSKDAIIETAFNEHAYILWGILVLTAGLTAFYSFRQVFLTFWGDERYKPLGFHPHEVQKFVLWALAPLAILAAVAGYGKDWFEHFVSQQLPEYHMSEHTHHIAWLLGLVVIAFAVGGIVLAYLKYAKGLKRDEKLEQSLPYRILSNQYYIPVFYEKVFSKPYAETSKILWEDIDKQVVDATVDGIASVVRDSGDSTRKLQTGNLSDYLKLMGTGALVLGAFVLFAAVQS
jgi:NADH-quinone oxidoreductase subunit L